MIHKLNILFATIIGKTSQQYFTEISDPVGHDIDKATENILSNDPFKLYLTAAEIIW